MAEEQPARVAHVFEESTPHLEPPPKLEGAEPLAIRRWQGRGAAPVCLGFARLLLII